MEEIVIQWHDGFGNVLEKSFDTVEEAHTEAQHVLQDLRKRFPNKPTVKVTVLQVLNVMTETGENVAKRI